MIEGMRSAALRMWRFARESGAGPRLTSIDDR